MVAIIKEIQKLNLIKTKTDKAIIKRYILQNLKKKRNWKTWELIERNPGTEER